MARCLLLIVGILGSVWTASASGVTKYDNYTLIRVIPTNDAQMKAVYEFEDSSGLVEILKRSHGFNDSLDILVPPERMPFVENYGRNKQIELNVAREHYGKLFVDEYRKPKRRTQRNFVYEYNSYSNILNFIENIAQKYPELVTLQNLGESFEGRPMKLVKISANPGAQNPVIFIDAGVHAREWVAPAMALYLIHRLTNDPEARRIDLNGVDWHILPVVNPDGYEYTRSGRENRMWRKTRSKHVSNCYGVDANRNYGFKWAVSGVSNNPCDKETYAGPKPFSEPETRMVRLVMQQDATRIKLYVSLHSYGQFLVYPWGFTGDYLPRSWKNLDKLAKAVSRAVVMAGGRPFTVKSAGQWYPAAGGSDDYAFGAVGVPYSYTMELTEGHEFIFPEELLQVVLPQFYQGFRVFGQQIAREFSGGLRASKADDLTSKLPVSVSKPRLKNRSKRTSKNRSS